MPNPIETVAQDMNLMRQSMEAMQSKLETTQTELREVKRAKTLAAKRRGSRWKR